jgi:hypothetical protein
MSARGILMSSVTRVVMSALNMKKSRSRNMMSIMGMRLQATFSSTS